MRHPDLELVERALGRDPGACRELVERLSPAIQQRVNAALIRRRGGSRQDVLDLTQEVFRMLVENEGRILRAWDPAKGASLSGYVALIAERRVASILRSGRRSGWAEDSRDPVDLDGVDEDRPGPEELTVNRETLALLLDQLRADLSERGFEMFHWMYIEERDVEWIVARAGLNRDAVYAWRARLQKAVARAAEKLESDPAASSRSKSARGGR